MRNRTTLFWLVAALVVLLLPGRARAQTSFQILDPIQFGSPGSTLTFHATITNNGSTNVYLNGDSISADPGLTADDTPFFNNFPFFLTPGQTVTDVLFDVSLDSPLAPADYFGSFTLLGGADSNAADTLGTQNFDVTAVASAVPEGNSLLCLLGGILPLAFFPLRRRYSHFLRRT